MTMSIGERVDSLEAILGHFIASTGASLNRLERVQEELSREMREFKEQMGVFKDETRAISADMNRKWGELANKMGTIVEDIVAPNMATIAGKYFDIDTLEFSAVRIRKEHPQKKGVFKEFDALTIGGNRIFYNETKSTPRMEYMEIFSRDRSIVFEYFPEHHDKALVPIFSSLRIPDEAVAYLTKQNIFAMAMAGNTMEILNFDDVTQVITGDE